MFLFRSAPVTAAWSLKKSTLCRCPQLGPYSAMSIYFRGKEMRYISLNLPSLLN